MFNLFLLAHVIGDFYLQSTVLAKSKEDNIFAVLIHSLIYGIVFAFVGLVLSHLKPFVILAVMHALIDLVVYFIRNELSRFKSLENSYVFKSKVFSKLYLMTIDGVRFKKEDVDKVIFGLDQLVHFLTFFWVMRKIPVTLNLLPQTFFGIDLNIILAFLLIYKPAGIFVQIFSNKYNISKKDKQQKVVTDPVQVGSVVGAGRFIGYLERSIVLLALLTKEPSIIISGVAMVLSAKTISRYGKTRDDEHFAEYFVIGTFLSILFTIGVAVLVT